MTLMIVETQLHGGRVQCFSKVRLLGDLELMFYQWKREAMALN